MKTLQEKLEGLEKQMKQKKEQDDTSDYEKAKREVKEEASKTEVNVDLIHEKLMHLAGVARKTNHEHKDKLSMILRRFHVHKR